ncbi:hypothetical protein ABI59_15685 [Acidobacteria bacterium Mor1]|nr:hypothetical protein ABI59_15685 [Acidobacteria bacterium Mor1]
MTTILKRSALLLGVLLLSGGIAVLAFGPGMGRGDRHGKGPGGGLLGPRMAQELGLSEAQQDEIRGLVETRMEAGLGDQLRQLRQARREIRGLMGNPATTEDQVLAAVQAVGTLEQEVLVERFRLRRDVQALLTPEQQARAQEIHQQREQKREEFRSRRGNRIRGGDQIDG